MDRVVLALDRSGHQAHVRLSVATRGGPGFDGLLGPISLPGRVVTRQPGKARALQARRELSLAEGSLPLARTWPVGRRITNSPTATTTALATSPPGSVATNTR